MPVTAPVVVTADPRSDPRWRALVTGSQGSLFTSPPWIEAVCGTYDFTPSARIVLNGSGEPVGGFAWVSIADVRGERLCSLPFSDWADPVSPDAQTWHTLVEGLITPHVRVTMRCLNTTDPARDPRLEVARETAWHATRLDVPIPELLRRLNSVARRNIARAHRAGLQIEANTGIDGIRQFHRLQVVLRKRKYRMLAQPIEFFERIWEAFGRDGSVVTILARLGGEPIAGVVFLVWNNVLHCKFAASLPEHLHLRPNDAIYWAGIEWGSQNGMRMTDWGTSDLDQPGLLRYKRKYATDEKRIVSLRSAKEPSHAEEEAGYLLDNVSRMMTDESVPDEITAKAGALLYRYFC